MVGGAGLFFLTLLAARFTSSGSSPRLPREPRSAPSLLLPTAFGVLAAMVGVAAYPAASQATLRVGFPLDDAWIHRMTYARNLALREWAFVPGIASGGLRLRCGRCCWRSEPGRRLPRGRWAYVPGRRRLRRLLP
jgi:hypothetical protein